ncbi:MAG: hypothetical protein K8U57_26140 [Planctomycetes bacterium]|nr:hypothetical protein [Planctomycetota bacterium]
MRTLRIIFLLGLAIGQGSSPAKADDPEIAIIAGEVIKVVDPEKGLHEASIKILRVYSGDQALKGITFVQPTANTGSAGLGSTIAHPLLKVGETGIWSLVVNKSTGRMSGLWTHRKGETDKGNYDHRIEWAEMVERLDKLNEAERFKLTKDLCRHKNPTIARYAVSTLHYTSVAVAKQNGVADFLMALPKSREVSHSALVELDRAFLDDREKKWKDSKERKALLERFTELLTEVDAEQVAKYLRMNQSLSDYEASVLVEKVLTNPLQSKAVRCLFVRSLTGKPGGPFGGCGDFAFDLVVGVIKNDISDDVRLQAAQGLVLVGPKFRATQQTALRILLKDETNSEIAAALREAIDKSK